MYLYFVLVCEGASDEGLVPHLQKLCISAGATEVVGIALNVQRLNGVGHTVAAKLRSALKLEPDANLIFVHRDADSRTGEPRYREIADAAEDCETADIVVCIVPVQETEAWLLLDIDAIRGAVGRPRGTARLMLPRPEDVERIARPKERLRQCLEQASEATGRRLERVRRDFPQHRRALLESLPVQGLIERVPSWARLRRELRAMIEQELATPAE